MILNRTNIRQTDNCVEHSQGRGGSCTSLTSLSLPQESTQVIMMIVCVQRISPAVNMDTLFLSIASMLGNAFVAVIASSFPIYSGHMIIYVTCPEV